ncbi:MAG: adenylate kinase family protein [Nitrososphaerales archaeon]|nr:adenylate kinase family protein [Nitrososphaerales archaeon]
MGRFLGITGTPGTGKKSVAPLVSAKLGLPCLSLNELASSGRSGRAGAREFDVDTALLRRVLLKAARGPCVVHGHLVPDVLQKRDVDMVVVLRCDPAVLKMRLRARGCPPAKVAANVEAELIGLVSASSITRFGRSTVLEFDTTSTDAHEAAQSVARLLKRTIRPAPPIDWIGDYGSAVKLRSLLSDESTESART